MRNAAVWAFAVAIMWLAVGAHAQAPSAQLPTASPVSSVDSLQLGPSAAASDSVADSTGAGLEHEPPALSKIGVVNRNFRYRHQIGLALGMMAFLAVIFTTTQNWNPD